VELSRFIQIVRGRLLLIVLLALGSAAAGFMVSSALPREYESEARVLVGSLTESNIDQLQANQQNAATYAELAKTPRVLGPAAELLGLGDHPAALADRIDVRAPIGQAIVRIVARAPSPLAAQQLADGVAAGIVALATPQGDTISIASIVLPAMLPDSPSSPRILLNTLIAACAGLGLALGLALLFPARRTEGLPMAPGSTDGSVPGPRGVIAGGTAGRRQEKGATDGVRPRYLGAAYRRLLLLGIFGGHRYYVGDVNGGRRYLATLMFGAGLALEGLLVVRAWPQQASVIGTVLGAAGLLLLAGLLIALILDAVRLPALVRGANAAADRDIDGEMAAAR
jgi:capsular polysaccharide biosynthesis protein